MYIPFPSLLFAGQIRYARCLQMEHKAGDNDATRCGLSQVESSRVRISNELRNLRTVLGLGLAMVWVLVVLDILSIFLELAGQFVILLNHNCQA